MRYKWQGVAGGQEGYRAALRSLDVHGECYVSAGGRTLRIVRAELPGGHAPRYLVIECWPTYEASDVLAGHTRRSQALRLARAILRG